MRKATQLKITPLQIEDAFGRAVWGESVRAIPRETRQFKVKDYGHIIERLISRIESLEKTRIALAADKPPGDYDMTQDDTFIRPDEDLPANPIL